MSDIPKIQVNDMELWRLQCDHKILPKWECQMWTDLADVVGVPETIVEVYLLTERKGYGTSRFVHKFIGYATVPLGRYLTLTEDRILK